MNVCYVFYRETVQAPPVTEAVHAVYSLHNLKSVFSSGMLRIKFPALVHYANN